ncbi:alpha/beta-hydrolase [Pyrenochaeta sp. DS3sAY3a]|nr:alpha/beta-hydrolase [Pyrenochaeta sp. DS3sAY3a]
MSSQPPLSLTQTFTHKTPTHSLTIKWTSLGSPISPPLIFIHGTPWSSLVWHALATALSHTYHVYIFDNPGFGSSPLESRIPDTEFAPRDAVQALDADLARQSAAFAALFKSWEADWKGRSPHVVAHDHGGLMSLRALLLHGCVYASLCLVDVVAIGPFGTPLFSRASADPGAFEALDDDVFAGMVEGYIRDAAATELDSDVMDALKEPWTGRGEDGKKGFVRQLCQAGARSVAEVEGRYKEVGERVRVKIIWGKEDRWIPVETAERLGEVLGAREVVLVEGAGHLVMYDQPGVLGDEIARWLGEK